TADSGEHVGHGCRSIAGEVKLLLPMRLAGRTGMNRQHIVLFRSGIMVALVLSLCAGAAPPQQSQSVQKAAKNQPSAASSAELDRMIAAGKSPRDLAQCVVLPSQILR